MLKPDQLDSLKRSRTKTRNRIWRAMELAGLTQVQLAELTGFTQSYISRVANGHYTAELPGETMRTFANVFGCTIEDLFPARDEKGAVA